VRKLTTEVNLDMFSVIGFEGAIVRPVKMDQNGHVAALLILIALGMMCLVPPRRKVKKEQPDHVPKMELIA
jgi:hypothetical protein